MRRPRGRGPAVDILVQSSLWKDCPAAEAIVRKAIAAAADRLSTSDGEVAIVLTDDSAIHALNRDWRGIDKPTNVLSFPAPRPKAAGGPLMLGDIVMAYETLARECADENRDFQHHLAHLAVHGFLHLMGYDHQTEAEAASMERLESQILTGLGVPDPYPAHDLDGA